MSDKSNDPVQPDPDVSSEDPTVLKSDPEMVGVIRQSQIARTERDLAIDAKLDAVEQRVLANASRLEAETALARAELEQYIAQIRTAYREKFRLRLEAHGETIRAFADGQFLDELEAPNMKGTRGMLGHFMNDKIESASYDNLEIFSLDLEQ